MDWQEWRVTEFMGAFLAPPQLLMQLLQRKIFELGLRLPWGRNTGSDEAIRQLAPDVIDALVLELAETFGLSPPFIYVRLRKYGLLGLG
jgi:hypothetical protein